MDSFYSQKELEHIGFNKIGENVRISKKASIYSPDKISIGSNVRVDDFCILSGSIILGNYIHIAAYTAIYGGSRGVVVDDFVNISSRNCIYSISDDYSGRFLTGPMVPNLYRNVQDAEVFIGKHVIIGSSSMVMPGVVIGEGCAFGAFSFINHSTSPWTVNVGIPCETIRERERNLLKLEKEMINEIRKNA